VERFWQKRYVGICLPRLGDLIGVRGGNHHEGLSWDGAVELRQEQKLLWFVDEEIQNDDVA